MNNYYRILGVTPHATLDQIKKAYRKQAKLLHPDVNKSSNAKEDFILLNEAYEFLLQTTGNNPNRIKRAQEYAKKRASYQREWEQKEREKARTRAQEYARMKYETYIKSDIYKTTEALNFLADFLGIIVVLLFLVGLPVLSYLKHGPIAILLSAIIILPTTPLWFRFFVHVIRKIHIQNILNKKQASIRSKMLNITILFIINVFIFFKIVLNTLIEIHWIYLLYGIAIITGILISLKIKRRYYRYLIKIGITPFIIHLFFLINFLFSSNRIVESYWYSYSYKNHSPILPTIHLNKDAYEKYHGIRVIFNGERIIGHNKITYEFEDGLLGLKVVKNITIE